MTPDPYNGPPSRPASLDERVLSPAQHADPLPLPADAPGHTAGSPPGASQIELGRTISADAACPPCEPEPEPAPCDPEPSAGRTRTRPRRKTTVTPAIVTTTLGDMRRDHPSPSAIPAHMQGRRRAHTVSVSLGPDTTQRQRSSLEAEETGDRLTPLSSVRGRGQEGDLENGLGSRGGRARSSSSASGNRPRRTSTPVEFDLGETHGQLNDEVVGLLDVIDPTVSTVNHLQNMTNSVLVPHFPQLWTRRPEIKLPETPSDESLAPLTGEYDPSTPPPRQRSATVGRSRKASISRFIPGWTPSDPSATPRDETPSSWGKTAPIRIPEGGDVSGSAASSPSTTSREREQDRLAKPSQTPRVMTPLGSVGELDEREMEDDIFDIKEDHQLDKHVKHVLRQSKRDKIKRGLKGVWTFVKTPMGAITAIYGFLVAFWGAGIVLFLLGWIPTSSKDQKSVWVEICSQVENGLFTVTGVGLIPWRVMDTYRMSVIWTLRERSRRLRKERGLPPIENPDDLPDPELIKDYVEVLSDEDRDNLRYQQEKFATSQTWYKPHATATHTAFPMKWALWNTILMDGNSFFQCILCGCMWGMTWRERPAWTTGTLIPLSFLCGIGAAVVIWRGSVRTKKTPAVSKKLCEALGVPLAIAVPRSADGTVLASARNTAPATDVPLHETESPSKTGAKTAGGGRRSTVAFGHVADGMGYDGEGKRGDGEKGRGRGSTLAAPELGVAERAVRSGPGLGARAGRGEKEGESDIALKEVKPA